MSLPFIGVLILFAVLFMITVIGFTRSTAASARREASRAQADDGRQRRDDLSSGPQPFQR